MTPRVRVVLAALGGFALGAWWMHLHHTCPDCQHRWAQLQRWWRGDSP